VARLPNRPEPRDAYVSHRHRHARHLIDKADWHGARDVLAALLARDSADELARQNITYVFQEWATKRIENEPADVVLEWLLGEAESIPAVRDDVRNAGAVLVNNAFVEAVQAKRFSQALEFASLGFEMTPDARSRENLLYGLQEAAKEAVSNAQPEQALAMFETLVNRHPELTEAGGILANVFYGEVEARTATGDTAGALAAASLLMRTPGIPEAEQVYAVALARHSEVVRGNDGPAAAFALWAEAAAAYPDSASIKTGAAQFANELAISHLEAGRFAEAISAFEAGLKFSPDDESLKANLRVAYINAAVTAANEGRLQEAAGFAEEGLSVFPADGDLTEILNYARGN
jgi:tetratricopeptide (TPR) repeat protein